MLYLHITKILLLFLLSHFFCRADSWCKLVFNYGKPTVNMFHDDDYDHDDKKSLASMPDFPGRCKRQSSMDCLGSAEGHNVFKDMTLLVLGSPA